jgi:hypothetical protein
MKEMDERNAFDILLDYPRDKRLAFDTHESTNRAFRIYKKDWLDRFLRFNKRKTGMKRIDRYYTITSRSKRMPVEINEESIPLFQQIHEKIHPLTLLVQNDRYNVICHAPPR